MKNKIDPFRFGLLVPCKKCGDIKIAFNIRAKIYLKIVCLINSLAAKDLVELHLLESIKELKN